MLKLYADKSFVNREIGHIPLLHPFWGNCDTEMVDKGRFDHWTKAGKEHISLVSIEDCDIVVLPSEWRPGQEDAVKLASLAEKHGKKIMIFFNSDSDEDIPIKNAIIFRTSFYKSKRKQNEFAMPAWTSDFCMKYLGGRLNLREKSAVPTVGYAGYIDYRNLYEKLKYAVRHPLNSLSRKETGQALRGRAVRGISKSRDINMRFIFRPACLTGSADLKSREEYVICLIDTDYTLVARGGGNFTYRLYEILSCGRIPIFVNTDCVLPFDHLIEWERHMVWIESFEIDTIIRKITDFHSDISHEEFLELQRKNRRLYEEWLNPTAFFSNIRRYVI